MATPRRPESRWPSSSTIVVGLLHATMGIYYAYTDRAPVFVIGATGPMDEGKRRPRVDWQHTANVQGTQVRDYVKWDYQPGGIDGVVDSFARAYSIMMTEPQGPIYMCYDAAIQEAPLEAPVKLPDSELGQGAEPDRARSGGAGGGGRAAAEGGLAGAAAAIRRPRRERLFRHGRARRDARRAGGRHGTGG